MHRPRRPGRTPIRYQEGGSHVVHRIPGPVDYGDVTLRYGLTVLDASCGTGS